jgi:hypothetical protein
MLDSTIQALTAAEHQATSFAGDLGMAGLGIHLDDAGSRCRTRKLLEAEISEGLLQPWRVVGKGVRDHACSSLVRMCVVYWRQAAMRAHFRCCSRSIDFLVDERPWRFSREQRSRPKAAVLGGHAQRRRAKSAADRLALSIAGVARNCAPCADQ